MCGGPTSTQLNLQQEQANFYANQISAYNKAYSNFTNISNQLQAQFSPILAAGPGQMGFTPQQLTAMNTQAAEGTAGYYRQAEKAAAEGEATLGGGTSNINMTSGPAQQIRAQIGATAAGQSASQALQIQQAGYQQGYNQWLAAIQGTQNLAAGWNPNSFASSTTSAGGLASQTASQIAQEQEAPWQSVMGALGGIAGKASFGQTAGPSGGTSWSI